MTMPWDELISESDREIFETAGWGRRAGFGERPALLVIDVNYNFCGDKEEPVLTPSRSGDSHVDRKLGTPVFQRSSGYSKRAEPNGCR